MQTSPEAGKTRRLNGLRRFAIDVTPLRASRDFRLLFGGQIIGVIGNQVRVVAIPYLVFLMTRSSLMVGLVSLAQFAPTLFLALAGGALADTIDRKRLLVISEILLVITAAMLAIPTLRGNPPLWYIFVIVTISAGIQAVDSPIRSAVIPRLVGREQVANAMAISQVTWQLGAVAGPAIAGLIIARFNIGVALMLTMLTWLISLVLLIPVTPMPPETFGTRPNKTGIAAIVEGLSFLKTKPAIATTFWIDINAMVFGMPTALFPALATQVFGVGPAGLGLLYAAPGAGALIGALVTGWVGHVRYQGRAVIIAVCIWGAAIAAFGVATHAFWLGLLMLAIAGAADMYSAVFRGTILQLGVPDRLRGRLTSVHFLVVTSGPRFGDMEAGTVAAIAGTQFSVVSGGLASIIGALIIAFAIPAFTHYDANSPAVLTE